MMCLLTRHKGNCINPLIFIIRDIKGEGGGEGEEGEEGDCVDWGWIMIMMVRNNLFLLVGVLSV